MTALRVRPAAQSDAETATRIMHDAFLANYAQFMPEQCIREWSGSDSFQSTVRAGIDRATVAEIKGRTVGVLIARSEWIEELWVAPDEQNSGVGTALMEKAEADIHREGHDTANLHCYEANMKARTFYIQRGYRQTARFMSTEVPGGPVPVLTFSKTLKQEG